MRFGADSIRGHRHARSLATEWQQSPSGFLLDATPWVSLQAGPYDRVPKPDPKAVSVMPQVVAGMSRSTSATLRVGDGLGGIDQTDVGEGLGEVPDELARGPVDLLREQPDVVGEAGHGGKGLPRRLEVAGEGESVGQPVGADPEAGFLATQAVRRAVPVDEASFIGQARHHGVDGAPHPGVIGR